MINMSSVCGLGPCPTSAVYSGTKTGVYMFTRCLQAEFQGNLCHNAGKIDILSVNPMMVSSAMTHHRKTIQTVTPEECVSAALPKLGRVPMTLGHWKHELQYTVFDALPTFIADRIQKKQLYSLLAEYNKITEEKAQKKSQ